MSDPTTDSPSCPPLQSGDLENTPRGTSNGAAAGKPSPARKRRPRPTFEDGALTRTFKFPSKTYPRSSYYVTSTEIIIRIKKARKKWKLVVPKKRLVSYRTNRWFAKPRWVAIELTFTQAVKLGLAEARTPSADAAVAIAASAAHTETPALAADSLAPEPVPNTHSDEADVFAQATNDASDQIDTSSEQDGADDDFHLAADLDDQDDGDEHDDTDDGGEANVSDVTADALLPPAAALRADEAPRIAPPASQDTRVIPFKAHPQQPMSATPEAVLLLAAPHPAADASRVIPFPVRTSAAMAAPMPGPLPEPIAVSKPRPRASRRRTWATLAAALAGYALWAAVDTAPRAPRPDCTANETTAPCASGIVTGSIAASGERAQPYSSSATEVAPLTPAQASDVAQSEIAAQAVAAAIPAPADITDRPDAATPTKSGDEPAAIVIAGRDIALPVSPPEFAAPAPKPAPVVVVAAATAPQPTVATPSACDSLDATTRPILITFAYARSQLDPAFLPALDDLAGKLRACPESTVRIEGHTDSDGRAAHNRSLSLRRAEAVQKHLVAAGVDVTRLAAAGFGQTRPALPNVSQGNKRNNRRAEIVVTVRR